MSNAQIALRLLQWCAGHPFLNPAQSVDGSGILDETREFLRSRDIESLYTIATGGHGQWQEAYDVIWRHKIGAVRGAIKALVCAGVRVLTFKGGELVSRHFPGRGLGLTADVDVLVQRDDIELAKSVLYKLDFWHAVYDTERRVLRARDVADVARIELHHYELAPFVRSVELQFGAVPFEFMEHHDPHALCLDAGRRATVVEIDLHHGVAPDVRPEMFFSRAVPSILGVGETFSAADHVWFNLTRYYNEVALHDMRSLRPLAYTLPEIAFGEIDWSVVERVAHELSLGPTLYYFLAFCARLAPGRVPDSTLAAVQRSTTSRVRDWGWQLGKLFDFEEKFPLYAFGEQLSPLPAGQRLLSPGVEEPTPTDGP